MPSILAAFPHAGAARLSQAEDARSLVSYSTGYATLATNSAALEGYPSAALVGYTLDAEGLPVFCFSAMSRQCAESDPPRPSCWRHSLPTPAAWDAQLRAEAAPRTPVGRPGRRLDRPSWRRLPPPARDTRSPMPRLPTRRSTHTKDLMAAERTCTEGGKAALCVTAEGFEGAADGRVTLIGDVKRVSDKEVDADGLRALYKAKHPNAYRPHVARSHLGGAAAHRPGPMKQALLAPGCLTHAARTAEQPRHPGPHPGPPIATHCHPGPPRATQGHPGPPRAPIKAAVPPRETRAPLGAESSAAAVDHTGSGPTLATSPTSACTASRPSTSSAASRAQAPSRPRTTSAPRSIRSRPSRHPNPNPDPNCNPSPNPKPNATPGPNLTLTRSRPSRRPSWAT